MTAAISLWMLLLVTSAVKHDFEQADTSPWLTTDKEFMRVKASEHLYLKDRPKVDTSLGTKEGHYLYAEYTAGQKEAVRFLFYSECTEPSGPRCRINMSTIIHTPHPMLIGAWSLCDHCSRRASRMWNEEIINSTGLSTQWTRQSVLLGAHPVSFEISIAVTVPSPDTYVAIDDIEFVDCEPEPVRQIVCPAKHSFQCEGSQQCLPADRLCDLHEDCEYCGDDETEQLCGVIPPEGFLRLHNCDFDSGECLWYNVFSEDRSGEATQGFRWRVVNTTVPSNSTRAMPATGNQLYESYLQVSMQSQMPNGVAILRSVSFEPRFSGDGLCQIRFWYRKTSRRSVLKLELAEIGRPGYPKVVRGIWESPGSAGDEAANSSRNHDAHNRWTRVVVELNPVPINVSFVLQFKTYSTDSVGDIALDSISLSRDCFYSALFLSTCNMIYGALGPTQMDCDHTYQQKGLVNVLDTGPFRGTQSWIVPETMTYRIQALGSSGGLGTYSSQLVKDARGSSVTAKFELDKGDRLYFLVGQQGENACRAQASSYDLISPFCGALERGGGGGGGGATIVFKVNNGSEPQVLLVAGGGGGLPFKLPFLPETAPEDVSTISYGTTASAGEAYTMSEKEALALLSDTLGGSLPCLLSTDHPSSGGTRGGFGGGGGGCMAGGHGGGADLTMASGNSSEDVGIPGRSYVHHSAMSPTVERGIHYDSGVVEVTAVRECPCDYQCLWLDTQFSKLTCLCPTGKVADQDGFSCAAAATRDREKPSHLFLVVLIGSFLVIFVSIACVCLYIQRHTLRARHPTSVKKMASFLCPCLHLARRPLSLSAHVLPQIQRPPAVMHVNPNYDMVSTKCPEQGLTELPRKHLKLMSELGQGAFGEVYYGLLSNVPMVEGDLPVAVKTLPHVCAEQTEMDFRMEAVIVSKFNHPNIVKLIGVCFDQHPHYLVLELLEGGDLKSFLRQGRPKWDQPSALTVLDLLRLSLDVARGCQHLEEKHFIHRDIAARNCLLTTKGPNRTAKIADFGMARAIYRSNYYKKAGKAMLPVKWMPPEAFLDGVFTSKTDVWSFGILMWEVFSLGHMPYPGCSNEEVMNLVTQGGRLDPPESCPSAVYDIMVSCWSGLPEGRPTFSLIIASLERALQDDDMVSRGLPVFYMPPIVNTRGLKLQDRQTPKQLQLKGNGTRAKNHVSSLAMSPNTSGDGYLEPLLRQSSRGVVNDGTYKFTPDNSNSSNDSSAVRPSCTQIAETAAAASSPEKKRQPRTSRVFYKPGTNSAHYSNDAAASEALLSPSNPSTKTRNSSDDIINAREDDLKYELCVALKDNDDGGDDQCNSCGDVHTVGEDDLKMAAAAALPERKEKRKSYTHFPRPSS